MPRTNSASGSTEIDSTRPLRRSRATPRSSVGDTASERSVRSVRIGAPVAINCRSTSALAWSIVSAAARPDACGGVPSVAGADITNTRNGVSYSLSVTIDSSSAPEPGLYPVYLDFVSDAGSVLDSASILVIVE
jgi:hypothetical protein